MRDIDAVEAREGAKVPPVHVGDILAGKYRVERVIGVGGMGVVVAATHVELLELRAIKFMLEAQIGDVEAVERFLREARAASRLKSEHAAKVHDVGRLENGAPYMVMEYLEGEDLRALLKHRRVIPVHEAALFVLQAAEALAEAHAAGIVHRDIKLANLFLTQGPGDTPCVKVLDFGISKVTTLPGGDVAVTKETAIMGSPQYMSPEQLRSSRDVDMRTDIWSLGVVLYQLVTGKLPFRSNNFAELVALVMLGPARLPSEVGAGIPAALDAVIMRCLERDLDRRYPSVADLAEALLPFAPTAGQMSADRIERVLRPSSRRTSRVPATSYDAPDSYQPVSARTDRDLLTLNDATGTGQRTGAPTQRSVEATSGTLPSAGQTPSAGQASSAAQSAVGSGAWRSATPNEVRVVPSRMPTLILSIAGALALMIVAVGMVVTRGSGSAAVTAFSAPPLPHDTAPSATVSAGAGEGTGSPPAPIVTPAAAASMAAPAPTASATATATATASGAGLGPKIAPRAGAGTAKPKADPSVKPPPPPADDGDAFGKGRK